MAFTLGRRTVLRGMVGGAAISLGLPPLEAMMNTNGTAHADETPIPSRFGVWYFGNGVHRADWIPSGTGTSWQPRAALAPLAPYRQWLTVISGCEMKLQGTVHHVGAAGIMTGALYRQLGTHAGGIVSTPSRASVDQIAAAHYDGQTPYRSLEVGVCRFRGTVSGTTWQYVSHNGPNDPNPTEQSPWRLYRRLFYTSTDARRENGRASVLDAVGQRITQLRMRVGSVDRQRLDRHFESIRSIEQRLERAAPACVTPDAPPVQYPEPDGREPILEKNLLMNELVALAFACDLTRVLTLTFMPPVSPVVLWYPDVGATDGYHNTTHVEAPPYNVSRRAVVFIMKRFAEFLEGLRDIPEGDGNLLDHSSILATTECTEGFNHATDDFPILIAGKGNGRLRGNLHYRSPNRENTSNAVLTALRAGGVPASSFGAGAGLSSRSIAAVET